MSLGGLKPGWLEDPYGDLRGSPYVKNGRDFRKTKQGCTLGYTPVSS